MLMKSVTYFFKHIELWLSAIGLVVIFVVPRLFSANGDLGYVTAITATAIGLLHGMIIWLVRRRQRFIRQRAIRELQLMLEDRIQNQLMVINLSLYTVNAMPERHKEAVANVQEAIRKISMICRTLDEESLVNWQRTYQHISTRTQSSLFEG